MTREDPRSVIDFLDDTDDEMPELIYEDVGTWYDEMPVLGVPYEPPFSFSRVLLLQYGGYYTDETLQNIAISTIDGDRHYPIRLFRLQPTYRALCSELLERLS